MPTDRDAAWTVAGLSRSAESRVGLFFCWGFGLVSAGLIVVTWRSLLDGIAGHPGLGWIAGVLATPVAIALLYLHFGVFIATWRGAKRSGPLGIEAALAMPKYPRWMRPIAAVWWAGHFIVGVLAAILVEVTSSMKHDASAARPDDPSPAFIAVFVVLMAFGIAFAGNTFLTLAASMFTRNESTLRRVWSIRLLIDAGVLIAAALIALAGLAK